MILVDGDGYGQIQHLKKRIQDTIEYHEKIKCLLYSRYRVGCLPDSEKEFYKKLEENLDQIIEDMSNDIKGLDELDIGHFQPKGKAN